MVISGQVQACDSTHSIATYITAAPVADCIMPQYTTRSQYLDTELTSPSAILSARLESDKDQFSKSLILLYLDSNSQPSAWRVCSLPISALRRYIRLYNYVL